MKKYVALFDWDKTVRQNYTFTTWTNILVDKEIISKEFLIENEKLLKEYIEGKYNHDDLANIGVEIFGKYIEGVDISSIISINDEYKKIDDLYIYQVMREKIFPLLKRNNISAIVITGCAQHLVELYKQELMIDEIYGLEFSEKEGKILNECEINTGVSVNKQKVIDKIIKDNDVEILFAFGDSISDIPLLKSAKYSFVNNTKKFLEKDNIFYLDFGKEEDGEVIISKMLELVEV